MKKVLTLAILAAGALLLAGTQLHAQSGANAQSVPAPVTATNSSDSAGGKGLGAFRPSAEQPSCRQAIMALNRVKLQLQHSKDDFDGHQKTAIEACDKAIQELELVLRSSHGATGASWVRSKKPAPKQDNKQ